MSTIDTTALQSLGLSAPQASQPSSQLGQSDFLKLMTAQMQNQDPTQPMKSGEFMTQIAQFGTVQGIQDLQKSFASLANSLTSNNTMQAAGLVGHNVLVPSDVGVLGSNGMDGAAKLSTGAAAVNVNIYDASGALVRQLPLGSQAAGQVNYHWDGLTNSGASAPPGLYQIKVEASSGGSSVQAANLSQTRVDSVQFSKTGQDIQVNLAGLGATAFSQLSEIR